MVPVRERSVLLVDLGNQFLDDVAFVFVIRRRNAVGVPAVVAFGCDNDEFVVLRVLGKFGLVGPVVVMPGQTVQEINDRIIGRCRIVCWNTPSAK